MDINKRFTERLVNALMVSSITVVMLLIIFMWLTPDEEDITDEYIVTIEYDCRNVLIQPKDFPVGVIEECRSRFRFLKEQPKSSI